MVKACIFDLEGVIVDTAKYHLLAWKKLAIQLGVDFTILDNELLKASIFTDSLEILLHVGKVKLTHQQMLFYADMKNQWYHEYIKEIRPDNLLPGTIDWIKQLKANGIKVALGSLNKNARAILELTEINTYFDVIIDGNLTQKAKPNPEVFLLAANELGVNPEDCIAFESTEAGIDAAIYAGMKCIGIGNREIAGKANLVVRGLDQMKIEKLKF